MVTPRQGIADRFNSPLAVMGVTGICYSVFILLRLACHQYDPTVFIVAGDAYVDRQNAPGELKISAYQYGYDGLFYYRFALDPFTSKQKDFGITIDTPSYRHQRVLYPLLSWLLSFGNAHAVPAAMIAVNFIGLCLIGYLGGQYARKLDQHAMWGLQIALYPGFLLSLSRNLTEIVAISLVLLGLFFLHKEKGTAAAISLCLAILARETSLLIAAGAMAVLGFESLRRRKPQSVPWLCIVAPIATYMIWQLVLYLHWGHIPVLGGTPNIGLPFQGMAYFFAKNFPPLDALQHRYFREFVFLALFTAAVFFSLRSSRAPDLVKASFVLYFLLITVLQKDFWREDFGYFRAATELFVLGAIIMLGSHRRWLRYTVTAATAVIWISLFRITVVLI